MKTILVATDFSSSALNAANYAADMALAINTDILLLHVSEDDIIANAEKNISELKEQLTRRTAGKLNIKTKVRVGVFYHQELKTVCEHIKPYAVVMGSQNKRAPARLFFSSESVHAMKHLMWPLITVPPGAAFSSIKKIGLACDFDKVVDTTPIDEIKKLVNDFNAELHVLNTGSKKVFNPEVLFESALLMEMLSAVKPICHFITSRNTDGSIMSFAEKNHYDLLVVLPKRHGLLKNLIHRSHTRQFVLNSNVPVMALHQ
jgi:nucleotide-binding universal stress UspA family protein